MWRLQKPKCGHELRGPQIWLFMFLEEVPDLTRTPMLTLVIKVPRIKQKILANECWSFGAITKGIQKILRPLRQARFYGRPQRHKTYGHRMPTSLTKTHRVRSVTQDFSVYQHFKVIQHACPDRRFPAKHCTGLLGWGDDSCIRVVEHLVLIAPK